MKRTLALLLTVAMLAATVVSCGNKNNTPADTTTAAPDAGTTAPADTTTALPEETVAPELQDTLPDVRYDGETFTALLRESTKYEMESGEITGDLLSDAVYQRNLTIEERFGVKVETLTEPGGWIDRDDFREDPPKKYFRLAPGVEVRLRYAYYITCQEVIKDENGNIVELHCTHDPASRGGSSPDGRKVKGTIHWVSARHAVPTEVRLYEQMISTESDSEIEEGKTFLDYFNKDSEQIVTAMAEPYLATMPAGSHVQFERVGYFCADPDGSAEHPVFNRTVTLKDSWAKIEKKG